MSIKEELNQVLESFITQREPKVSFQSYIPDNKKYYAVIFKGIVVSKVITESKNPQELIDALLQFINIMAGYKKDRTDVGLKQMVSLIKQVKGYTADTKLLQSLLDYYKKHKEMYTEWQDVYTSWQQGSKITQEDVKKYIANVAVPDTLLTIYNEHMQLAVQTLGYTPSNAYYRENMMWLIDVHNAQVKKDMKKLEEYIEQVDSRVQNYHKVRLEQQGITFTTDVKLVDVEDFITKNGIGKLDNSQWYRHAILAKHQVDVVSIPQDELVAIIEYTDHLIHLLDHADKASEPDIKPLPEYLNQGVFDIKELYDSELPTNHQKEILNQVYLAGKGLQITGRNLKEVDLSHFKEYQPYTNDTYQGVIQRTYQGKVVYVAKEEVQDLIQCCNHLEAKRNSTDIKVLTDLAHYLEVQPYNLMEELLSIQTRLDTFTRIKETHATIEDKIKAQQVLEPTEYEFIGVEGYEQAVPNYLQMLLEEYVEQGLVHVKKFDIAKETQALSTICQMINSLSETSTLEDVKSLQQQAKVLAHRKIYTIIVMDITEIEFFLQDVQKQQVVSVRENVEPEPIEVIEVVESTDDAIVEVETTEVIEEVDPIETNESIEVIEEVELSPIETILTQDEHDFLLTDKVNIEPLTNIETPTTVDVGIMEEEISLTEGVKPIAQPQASKNPSGVATLVDMVYHSLHDLEKCLQSTALLYTTANLPFYTEIFSQLIEAIPQKAVSELDIENTFKAIDIALQVTSGQTEMVDFDEFVHHHMHNVAYRDEVVQILSNTLLNTTLLPIDVINEVSKYSLPVHTNIEGVENPLVKKIKQEMVVFTGTMIDGAYRVTIGKEESETILHSTVDYYGFTTDSAIIRVPKETIKLDKIIEAGGELVFTLQEEYDVHYNLKVAAVLPSGVRNMDKAKQPIEVIILKGQGLPYHQNPIGKYTLLTGETKGLPTVYVRQLVPFTLRNAELYLQDISDSPVILDIEETVKQNMLGVLEPNLFYPVLKVSVKTALTAIARAIGHIDGVGGAKENTELSWYQGSIQYLEQQGVIDNLIKEQMETNKYLLREELCYILNKVYQYTPKETDIKDIDQVNTIYLDSVNAMVATGVVPLQEARIMPKDVITREELAYHLVKVREFEIKNLNNLVHV